MSIQTQQTNAPTRRVLITGANSYIGQSFETWVQTEHPGELEIGTLDMLDSNWRNHNFSQYDTIVHVAGIVHQSETEENKESYYVVNRDLPIELSKIAKAQGVKQFVFFSTMSVYGLNEGHIDSKTPTSPISNYGISKLEAEEGIGQISDDNFAIAVLRPPMIYGKSCRGNYISLSKLAKKLPVFPSINNRRSMLYIDNLSELLYHLVLKQKSGLFFPQNSDYVSTKEIVLLIAKAHSKNIRLTPLFNWAIKLLARLPGKPKRLVEKAFGSLTYDLEMSRIDFCDYQLSSIEDSVQKTEG